MKIKALIICLLLFTSQAFAITIEDVENALENARSAGDAAAVKILSDLLQKERKRQQKNQKERNAVNMKCARMTAKAKTEWSATRINISCRQNQGNMRSTDMKCARMTAKAKTEWSATKIYISCRQNQGNMNALDMKCAKKSLKAKTEWSAQNIWMSCMQKD